MLNILWLAVAVLISSVSSQTLKVTKGSSAIQCHSVTLKWSGGTAPYQLSLVSAPADNGDDARRRRSITGEILRNFGSQSGSSFVWTVDLASGTTMVAAVTDSSGLSAQSQVFPVENSGNSSCVTAPDNNGASSTTLSQSSSTATSGSKPNSGSGSSRPHHSSGLSTGKIVGIAFAFLALLLAGIFVLICCRRSSNRRRRQPVDLIEDSYRELEQKPILPPRPAPSLPPRPRTSMAAADMDEETSPTSTQRASLLPSPSIAKRPAVVLRVTPSVRSTRNSRRASRQSASSMTGAATAGPSTSTSKPLPASPYENQDEDDYGNEMDMGGPVAGPSSRAMDVLSIHHEDGGVRLEEDLTGREEVREKMVVLEHPPAYRPQYD